MSEKPRTKIKYDIYFHGNCLDGLASAAMLKWFLNKKGDDFEKYIPLQHPVNKKWWKKLKMNKPSAIVDIIYHPKAKIWFDHHPTTFIDNKWEKGFKKDIWHVWETKSPSCAGLILREMRRQFKLKLPNNIRVLAKWTDLLDRIDFKKITVKDLLKLKEPALQLGFYLDQEDELSVSKQKEIINLLQSRSLLKIMQTPWLKRGFKKYKNKLDKSLPKIKKMIVIHKNTAFVNNIERSVIGVRFAPFYFYPKCHYSVRFTKHGDKYIFGVGVNPWNQPRNRAKIGEFLEKNFGGGGHAYAGSAPFNSKKEALKALPRIIEYLNKHG